jgi:hypothetical protein
MKTLFFQKKVVALFNCTTGADNKNAIRLHIYNLVQNELVYETNFTICENELTLEDIKVVTFENDTLVLEEKNGNRIITNYNTMESSSIINYKIVAKNKSNNLFSTSKIKEFFQKLNQTLQVPQFNNFL